MFTGNQLMSKLSFNLNISIFRPYKVPIPIPAFVLLASVFLVIVPIVDNPKLEFLYAALIILAGLFIYIPFCFLKKKLACMGNLV